MVSVEHRKSFINACGQYMEDSPHLSYFIWKDGDVTRSKYRAECYGSIMNNCEEDETEPETIVVFHAVGENNFDQEVYDWVMAEENFGSCFVDTSLENGLKVGWELDTSLPYGQVLGAMISLRHAFSVQRSAWNNSGYLFWRGLGATVQEALLLNCISTADQVAERLVRRVASDHFIFGDCSKLKYANNPPNFDGEFSLESLIEGDSCFWDCWEWGVTRDNTFNTLRGMLPEGVVKVERGVYNPFSYIPLEYAPQILEILRKES